MLLMVELSVDEVFWQQRTWPSVYSSQGSSILHHRQVVSRSQTDEADPPILVGRRAECQARILGIVGFREMPFFVVAHFRIAIV